MRVAKIASMQFLLASLLTQTRGIIGVLLMWHCLKLRACALVATSCHVMKIVVPFSSNMILAEAPGNVYLEKDITGLSKDSVALVSQVSVVDKSRLKEKITTLPFHELREIEKGIRLVLNFS